MKKFLIEKISITLSIIGRVLTKLNFMEKYRIVRFESFNKKGELIGSYFYIEKSWKFFGRTFWSYVRENTTMETWPEGSYRKRMKFKFITEAQHFIEEILIPERPYDTSIKEVIQVY